jgi:hypothetical protein
MMHIGTRRTTMAPSTIRSIEEQLEVVDDFARVMKARLRSKRSAAGIGWTLAQITWRPACLAVQDCSWRPR